jgi:hypothetical protein
VLPLKIRHNRCHGRPEVALAEPHAGTVVPAACGRVSRRGGCARHVHSCAGQFGADGRARNHRRLAVGTKPEDVSRKHRVRPGQDAHPHAATPPDHRSRATHPSLLPAPFENGSYTTEALPDGSTRKTTQRAPVTKFPAQLSPCVVFRVRATSGWARRVVSVPGGSCQPPSGCTGWAGLPIGQHQVGHRH